MFTHPKYFVLASLLFFYGCAPHAIDIQDESKQNKPFYTIYVINHGWHTAFILPAQGIQQQIPELQSRFPNAPYLTFGWGDKDVYQADEVKFLPASKAILLPTDAVMHVVDTPIKPDPKYSDAEIYPLCLPHHHYQILLKYIEISFRHDAKQRLIPTALDDGVNSQFYHAEGTYFFMNTCNNWTAKGLKSTGFNISPTFKFTAGSITNYLKQDKSIQSQPCFKSVGK